MAVDDEFHDFLRDELSPLGPVTIRRMFGGGGVFLDGLMFGLTADGVLYFKVDDETRPGFEAEASEPFFYTKNGKEMALGYWRAPERLFDDSEDLCAWARRAFEVALRADAAKPPSKSKRTSRQA